MKRRSFVKGLGASLGVAAVGVNAEAAIMLHNARVLEAHPSTKCINAPQDISIFFDQVIKEFDANRILGV